MQKTPYLLLLLFSCALLLTHPLHAQLGMGGKPHPSAALDVQSTNKAFYPPRLTTTQRNAIADPQPGALVFDTDKGGLYLYDGTTWMVIAFTAPENQFSNQVNAGDGVSGDKFGYSVAISGDYAIIGAVGDATDQGSAYIFKRSDTGWAQQSKLTASDGSASDFFGCSVAIDGIHVVVGAYGDDMGANNNNQGSAYFFYRNGTNWTQQEKVTASDANDDDKFGFSVFLSGDYAIIGAPGNDINLKTDQGAAYIFIWSGIDIDPFAGYVNWTEQERLLAGDGLAGDEFGRSVAIAGNHAIIGAPYSDNGVANSDRGSAYIFYTPTGSTWTQQGPRFTNGTLGGSFGHSVGISGVLSSSSGYAVVGAPNADILSNSILFQDAGTAYVYNRTNSTWTLQATLAPISAGASDYFGISVGITANGGDRIIVGANGDNVGSNTNQGAAYLYERAGSSWPLVRKLAGVSGTNAGNGRSVDISGSRFIIGAPGFLNSTGKATFGSVDN